MATVTVISPVTGKPVEHKRVAAYCRVSTNSADQQNSYNTQVRYYTRYIKSRTEWTLVDIFADEGLSGTSSEKRENFQRMITMCELKQIDLVVTKSVSRFARNVKETLEYVRKLKLLGIGVVFEKEGINTLSMGDEMLLNTFAAIAQEESVSISQNVRFSIKKKMESGEYINGCVPFGYRLENKVMIPFEPEAEIVRSQSPCHRNAREIQQGTGGTRKKKDIRPEISESRNHGNRKILTICALAGADLRRMRQPLQARPLEHPRQEKHRVALCQPLGPRHTILQGISHSQRRQAQGSRRPCNPTIQ